MEKKDERKPRLPAGTFAASDPPPAPRRSDPGVLADGVAHSSAPPPPPSGPHHGFPAIDRRRYTSTLTGTGGPAPGEGAPPLVAPVLAPPKWRGAKAYLDGQEPKPRVTSIPTPAPVPEEHAAAPAEPRQRVNTKLGPAPPPAPPPAPLLPNAEAAIDQAIERMLEGQAAVSMEVEAQEPDETDTLEELPMEAATPLDEPSERAVPLARVALKSAAARVPPAAPVEAPAHAREESGPAPAGGASEVEPVAAPAAPQPAAATAEQPAAPTFAFDEPERAAEPKPEPRPEAAEPAGEPGPARKRDDDRPGVVAKPARAPLAAAANPDQSLTWGLILLSLIVVVGAGGWLVTRGGFRRSVPPPSALAPVKAAPVTEPLPTAVPPAAPASAPATGQSEPAPKASESVTSSTLHAARQTHAAHGRSSSSHRRGTQPDPEPAPTAAPPEEPVLRVSPHGAAQPSETPTRQEVLDALEPLRPAVERCAHGQHGIAQLDITVVSSGTVTHAVVAGDFAGTPEGSCIALAARKAQFAPFRKPRFRVIFPFSL